MVIVPHAPACRPPFHAPPCFCGSTHLMPYTYYFGIQLIYGFEYLYAAVSYAYEKVSKAFRFRPGQSRALAFAEGYHSFRCFGHFALFLRLHADYFRILVCWLWHAAEDMIFSCLPHRHCRRACRHASRHASLLFAYRKCSMLTFERDGWHHRCFRCRHDIIYWYLEIFDSYFIDFSRGWHHWH